MVAAVWSELGARHDVRRDIPSTWRLPRVAGFQALTREDVFAALAAPAVVEALGALLGDGGWRSPGHWGAPLVVFPEPGRA